MSYQTRKVVSGKAMGNPWGFPHAVYADENVSQVIKVKSVKIRQI